MAERLNVKESEVIEMGQRMDNWDVSLEAPVRSDSEDEQKKLSSPPMVQALKRWSPVRRCENALQVFLLT